MIGESSGKAKLKKEIELKRKELEELEMKEFQESMGQFVINQLEQLIYILKKKPTIIINKLPYWPQQVELVIRTVGKDGIATIDISGDNVVWRPK